MSRNNIQIATFNNLNKRKEVTILERKRDRITNSGVMYRVTPALDNGTEKCWYDADWFQPA